MDQKPRPFIHRKKTKRHDEVGVLMIGRFALPLVIPYTILVVGLALFAIVGAVTGHAALVLSLALVGLVFLIVYSIISSIVKTVIRANKDEREEREVSLSAVRRPPVYPSGVSSNRRWRDR